MVLCFVKTALCLYLSCSVVVSYQANRELPYYSDRTNSNYATSKYSGQRPGFNKVMTRIENLNDQVNGKWSQHKIRHKTLNKFTTTTSTTTTTEAGLFETYGDLEEEDYFDSYEDNLEDEDDNFDYEDDEESADTFENTFDDIQAEEPTEPPTRVVQPPARPVSDMTEYKWQHYGTVDRVQESRRQQLNLKQSKEQLKVRAALDHYARIFDQSKCHFPSPKVIPVQQEYPDPSKTYTPHCTVLHRCADDTGCCKSNTKCQYKSREIVYLYFYTQSGPSNPKVEKLAFYNHTECECREQNLLTTDGAVNSVTYKSSIGVPTTTNAPKEERCKCPKEFKAIKSTTKCNCDCESDNDDCIQLKKGKEHFSMTDRVCLQEGRCGLPICEYGSYSLDDGKCPTKQDKFEQFSKINIY